MLSVCGYIHWVLHLNSAHWLSLAGTVVPERRLHTFLAVKRALVKPTLESLVVGKVTATQVNDIALTHHLLYSLEDSNCLVRRSVVVTPHHRLVVGIGSDNGNLTLLQWQDAVVLQ